MKELFCLLILSLVPISIFSQEGVDTTNLLPKRIVSVEYLNIGGSFPIGSFGNRSKSNENSGFANPGIKIEAGMNYQIYKNLGVKAQLIYQNNQMDNLQYKKELQLQSSSYSYSLQSNGWNNASAMMGVFANFKLDEHLFFQPKILLGANFGRSPQIDLTVKDSLSQISNIRQNPSSSFAFCFLLGMDFRINLDKSNYLIIGADAFNADMFFNEVRVTNMTANSGQVQRIKQPVQTIGLKMGVGFTLK